MNRIETKIVVAVTNRLAAATESDAKEEMIEELSENLYQRYLELSGDGKSEEEAFKEAMTSLGDVNELLAYLEEENGGRPNSQTQENKSAVDAQKNESADDAQKEESADDAQYRKDSFENDASYGKRNDWENGFEDFVNAAICAAKTAVDYAGDMVKEASDQVKRKYPEGVFSFNNAETEWKVESTEFAALDIRALDIHLTNGDIQIFETDEEKIKVNICGDTDEIETAVKEDGVLSIRQLNTASAHFFFIRGMRRTDVQIRLPKKVWDEISIATTNGNVELTDSLECRELKTSITSGDVKANKLSGERFQLHSISGDIEIRQISGNLHAKTKSGDIKVNGNSENCELSSISGDVKFRGESREISINTTSGDLEAELHNLPENTKLGSKSGDCRVKLPDTQGFRLSYRTVSGDFSTSFSFTGNPGAKNGEIVYGDPICGNLQITSISGDIRICEL